MRVLLSTYESRGDVEPMVGSDDELHDRRGRDVPGAGVDLRRDDKGIHSLSRTGMGVR